MTAKNNISLLKKLLRQGHYTVYTSLNHVSPSGMLRSISLKVVIKNKIVDITGLANEVLLWGFHKKGGLKVTGCGMDMGFYAIYSLSQQLYCPKKYNHDLAYKLKQVWL